MKFFFRILLILIIAGIALTILNKEYEKGHTRYYWHETERIHHLLNKDAYYDILFIGSSRTHVHYNPKVIDSITHLSSYNFGVEGGNLLETNLWLQVYLQIHQQPKMVILDLAAFAFDIDKRPFFNHTIYFPYLKNEIIYNIVARYKRIGLYKYLPFLEFMEVDDYNKFNAIRGLLGEKEEKSSGYTYNGYAENGTMGLKPGAHITYDTNTYKITETGKKILNAIIDSCRNRNINLVLTYSPEYYKTGYADKKDFFEYVMQVARKCRIPFYDYRTLSICKDSFLFVNPGHLNKYGANIFSGYVAETIIQEVSNK